MELIVSDVDGTLLTPQQELAPATRRALHAAAEAGVPIVLATGERPVWRCILLLPAAPELVAGLNSFLCMLACRQGHRPVDERRAAAPGLEAAAGGASCNAVACAAASQRPLLSLPLPPPPRNRFTCKAC